LIRESYNLREIKKSDWKILLEWRNDEVTRQNFFNSELISESEHKEYIVNTISSLTRRQFILDLNEDPVGTIREDKIENDEFVLSYTVSPIYRGMKIGQIMMAQYLSGRKGNFLCEIWEKNIPSIKMIEKLGFQFLKENKSLKIYKLEQS
jgi:RimJ/RimL family protein N-acetyltransferase